MNGLRQPFVRNSPPRERTGWRWNDKPVPSLTSQRVRYPPQHSWPSRRSHLSHPPSRGPFPINVSTGKLICYTFLGSWLRDDTACEQLIGISLISKLLVSNNAPVGPEEWQNKEIGRSLSTFISAYLLYLCTVPLWRTVEQHSLSAALSTEDIDYLTAIRLSHISSDPLYCEGVYLS